MKIKNISNKVIGIGELSLVPGQEADVPMEHMNNHVLKVYENLKLVEITGIPVVSPLADGNETVDPEEAAEKLRLARLASLDGITEEALGALAYELGINPATAKDQKSLLTKVRNALKK